MSVKDYADLNWFNSQSLSTALTGDEGDSSLVVEKDFDVFGRPTYFPSVNYDNQFHSLEPTPDPIAARMVAWHKFLELRGARLNVEGALPLVDGVYVRTGSDGFVDELELLT